MAASNWLVIRQVNLLTVAQSRPFFFSNSFFVFPAVDFLVVNGHD